MSTKEQIIERLSEALKEIIRMHDDEWSDSYRETGLASDMADIAREVVPTFTPGESNDS